MPHFLSTFRWGRRSDAEDVILPDLVAAQQAAAKLLGQWHIDSAAEFWSGGHRLLKVTDELGLVSPLCELAHSQRLFFN